MDLVLATDTIASAGAALTAAGRAAPGAVIPACPGWTVADAVRHVGQVHAWAATAVVATERPPFPDAPPDLAPADVAAWADAQRAALLAALAEADADRPVWAFGPLEPARFWWRRQAEETAVHAWDATSAAGDPWPIPGDVAVEGVDEMLGWFLPRRMARGPDWGGGRTLHLHRTDGDGEWLVTLTNPPTVEPGHAKGDLAVRGPASELLLWTMNRPAGVDTFGDESLAVAWRENVTF